MSARCRGASGAGATHGLRSVRAGTTWSCLQAEPQPGSTGTARCRSPKVERVDDPGWLLPRSYCDPTDCAPDQQHRGGPASALSTEPPGPKPGNKRISQNLCACGRCVGVGAREMWRQHSRPALAQAADGTWAPGRPSTELTGGTGRMPLQDKRARAAGAVSSAPLQPPVGAVVPPGAWEGGVGAVPGLSSCPHHPWLPWRPCCQLSRQ